MTKLVAAFLICSTLAFAVGLSGLPGPALAAALQWAVDSGVIAMDGGLAELALGAIS